ncbi:hypothetical protein HMPREF0454_03724 [Hafnia alvei ATCC 51873]|uniref:Uncharacterized protein n=1 Tax=Hafnia alvei ATCC 51873 TaxID=1002364 RepID=G9YAU7_HAFAL|nr:hypothetical protein HMPREF0454_03724 [Hafnia alvei ATCC 51873]
MHIYNLQFRHSYVADLSCQRGNTASDNKTTLCVRIQGQLSSKYQIARYFTAM